MATLADVQAAAWQAVNPQMPVNPGAAIYKAWLSHKVGFSGPLGMPVALETAVDEGGVAQAFSSGCIVWWTGGGTKVL